jgi:hypothetical protein
VIVFYDELVAECAEEVAAWLEGAMVDGTQKVLTNSEAEDTRVPVEVEVKTGAIWG